MTVYSYARVSTSDQATEDRSSLETQRRACEAAATIANLDAPIHFSDPGVSGSTRLEDRPEGGKMFSLLKSGDVVIAAKLDRLFRSAADALNNVEAMKAKGVKLILIDIGTEPVTESAVAKMFFGILASVAEFEKNRILGRMKTGRDEKRKKGGHIGGPPPYGFRKVGFGKLSMLEPDEAEQKLVTLIRTLGETGISLHRIATRLGYMGHTTRKGTPWSSVQVGRIIRRDADVVRDNC